MKRPVKFGCTCGRGKHTSTSDCPLAIPGPPAHMPSDVVAYELGGNPEEMEELLTPGEPQNRMSDGKSSPRVTAEQVADQALSGDRRSWTGVPAARAVLGALRMAGFEL